MVLGAHALVDQHAAVDGEARGAGQLGVGRDAGGDEEHVGLDTAPVRQVRHAHATVALQRGRVGARQQLQPQPLQIALQQRRRARVELPPQKPVSALEHGRAQPELVQRVGGLQPEQAAARHDRAARPVALGERAQAERVVGGAQHERPRRAEPRQLRHERARARREDQPVVRERLAGAELHVLAQPVDRARARVEPRRDPVLLVPALRVQVQALHRGAAVDQPRDAHAVVEVVRLLGDDVDLRERVAPADVVGGGHAGDPVAEHDDALDRAVELERGDPRERRLRRLLRLELHRHRALDARAARHARVLREAEPVERGALVVADPGQVLHPVGDAHRIGAADAHPAAGLDRQARGLGRLEQRHPGLGDDVLALGLERDLGRAGGQRAVRRHRAPGREVDHRLGRFGTGRGRRQARPRRPGPRTRAP